MANKATILIADDDEDIRLALALLLGSEGYRTIEADNPQNIVIKAQRENPDLVLLDMNFSRDTTSGQEGLAILQQLKGLPTILMTAWGSIDLAVQGLQQGAADFVEKPWHKHKLLGAIANLLEREKLKQVSEGYRQLLRPAADDDWVCQSQAMQKIEQMIGQIAPTDANILILGENGCGKSQLAERIHRMSARHQHPMISVNMAAIAENLFESELFGHQKGAFTDAKQNRVGRFRLAQGGTLFLDEIGTLPTSLQAKLLRVLENGEFEVLGSSHTEKADVRLVSATNADLHALIEQNQFRRDLLYRLNTLTITIPPLRERLADIAPLATLLCDKFAQKYNKPKLKITDCAIERLKKHSWPGNVRELSHVIERAVLLALDDTITSAQLMLDSDFAKTNDMVLQPLDAAEQQLIEKALDSCGGAVTEAAKILGISRSALYRRMEKYGIEDK